MKPTKMRNRQIWQATHNMRSRQLGAALSDDLRAKHSRRSIRVITGDSVKVVRGEYKDVTGKVSQVFAIGGRIAIEGVKKEKGKGEKFDVQIHSTNVVVTSLNTDDSRRMKRLRGESTKGHTNVAEPTTATPEPEASAADKAPEAPTTDAPPKKAKAKTAKKTPDSKEAGA